jgi:glycosyltransferase involved in cell wall biosynthesis
VVEGNVTHEQPYSENKKTVIAVIPAYNEVRNICKIIEKTKTYVNSIIIVDDGSQDGTGDVARAMHVKVVHNAHRMGKGLALKKGLIESSKYNADIVITMDADGQHDPAEIPLLLKPIEDGQADIVIGSRYLHNLNEVPKFRQIGLSIINSVNKLLTKTIVTDSQSGFRAYKKDILSIISNCDSRGYGIETEQLARAESYGLRITEVPINVKYKGLLNTSKKNSVLHGANIISTILKIAVERRPLLFFGLSGLILMTMAIIITSDILLVFNETRYFSIPLALITLGLAGIGVLLVLASLILYVLKRIRDTLLINK